MQIADVYSARPMGREELGFALRRLARQVRRSSVELQPSPVSSKPARARGSPRADLMALDESAIEAFIDDPAKTKDQLLELAAARFSMARSQLRRERAEVIRQSIRSALMHESSIEIIGAEATKGGNARRS